MNRLALLLIALVGLALPSPAVQGTTIGTLPQPLVIQSPLGPATLQMPNGRLIELVPPGGTQEVTAPSTAEADSYVSTYVDKKGVTRTVKTVRRWGENDDSFFERFANMCDKMEDRYPPMPPHTP